MSEWIDVKESLPPLREGLKQLSIDVKVKVGIREGLGVYNCRDKWWSTEPPLSPNRVSHWRMLLPEELPPPPPENPLVSRMKKMREELVRQAEFMGGAATADQLIDVIGFMIEIGEEMEDATG